ncbi:hypothetical protein CSUI_010826 [Cystoisospora suis]|uniref:Transmembrane protein n=1 Tax=Cystoisospora suis TaxID=483139 RepID=A0A2C6KG60_9APIC|nr:hypothetical protein CSUI_010826 [Cystoisospora suis]
METSINLSPPHYPSSSSPLPSSSPSFKSSSSPRRPSSSCWASPPPPCPFPPSSSCPPPSSSSSLLFSSSGMGAMEEVEEAHERRTDNAISRDLHENFFFPRDTQNTEDSTEGMFSPSPHYRKKKNGVDQEEEENLDLKKSCAPQHHRFSSLPSSPRLPSSSSPPIFNGVDIHPKRCQPSRLHAVNCHSPYSHLPRYSTHSSLLLPSSSFSSSETPSPYIEERESSSLSYPSRPRLLVNHSSSPPPPIASSFLSSSCLGEEKPPRECRPYSGDFCCSFLIQASCSFRPPPFASFTREGEREDTCEAEVARKEKDIRRDRRQMKEKDDGSDTQTKEEEETGIILDESSPILDEDVESSSSFLPYSDDIEMLSTAPSSLSSSMSPFGGYASSRRASFHPFSLTDERDIKNEENQQERKEEERKEHEKQLEGGGEEEQQELYTRGDEDEVYVHLNQPWEVHVHRTQPSEVHDDDLLVLPHLQGGEHRRRKHRNRDESSMILFHKASLSYRHDDREQDKKKERDLKTNHIAKISVWKQRGKERNFCYLKLSRKTPQHTPDDDSHASGVCTPEHHSVEEDLPCSSSFSGASKHRNYSQSHLLPGFFFSSYLSSSLFCRCLSSFFLLAFLLFLCALPVCIAGMILLCEAYRDQGGLLLLEWTSPLTSFCLYFSPFHAISSAVKSRNGRNLPSCMLFVLQGLTNSLGCIYGRAVGSFSLAFTNSIGMVAQLIWLAVCLPLRQLSTTPPTQQQQSPPTVSTPTSCSSSSSSVEAYDNDTLSHISSFLHGEKRHFSPPSRFEERKRIADQEDKEEAKEQKQELNGKQKDREWREKQKQQSPGLLLPSRRSHSEGVLHLEKNGKSLLLWRCIGLTFLKLSLGLLCILLFMGYAFDQALLGFFLTLLNVLLALFPLTSLAEMIRKRSSSAGGLPRLILGMIILCNASWGLYGVGIHNPVVYFSSFLGRLKVHSLAFLLCV